MAATEYNRVISDVIPYQLTEDLFANVTIGGLFDFIKCIIGDDYCFQFSQVLTISEEAELDSVIAAFVPRPVENDDVI